MSGGDGDDILIGTLGDDTISGNEGDDLLDGALGRDRVDGGPGANLFLCGIPGDTLVTDAADTIGPDYFMA